MASWTIGDAGSKRGVPTQQLDHVGLVVRVVVPPCFLRVLASATGSVVQQVVGGLAGPVEQLGVGRHEVVDRSHGDTVGDEVLGHAGRAGGELGAGPAVLDDGREVVRVAPREAPLPSQALTQPRRAQLPQSSCRIPPRSPSSPAPTERAAVDRMSLERRAANLARGSELVPALPGAERHMREARPPSVFLGAGVPRPTARQLPSTAGGGEGVGPTRHQTVGADRRGDRSRRPRARSDPGGARRRHRGHRWPAPAGGSGAARPRRSFARHRRTSHRRRLGRGRPPHRGRHPPQPPLAAAPRARRRRPAPSRRSRLRARRARRIGGRRGLRACSPAGPATRSATDPALARDTAEWALTLWRGPAYADVADTEWGRAAAVHLDELRLVAMQVRFDAQIELGRHDDVIAELDRAVDDHPMHERFTAQLMLSLYRSGRQVEALRTFDRTRERLVEELGLEPGPELLRLQSAILGHDDWLSAPIAVATAAAQVASPAAPAASGAPEGPAPASPVRLPGAALRHRDQPFVGRSAELGRAPRVLGRGPRRAAPDDHRHRRRRGREDPAGQPVRRGGAPRGRHRDVGAGHHRGDRPLRADRRRPPGRAAHRVPRSTAPGGRGPGRAGAARARPRRDRPGRADRPTGGRDRALRAVRDGGRPAGSRVGGVAARVRARRPPPHRRAVPAHARPRAPPRTARPRAARRHGADGPADLEPPPRGVLRQPPPRRLPRPAHRRRARARRRRRAARRRRLGAPGRAPRPSTGPRVATRSS